MKPTRPPTLSITNRQKALKIDARFVRTLVRVAFPLVFAGLRASPKELSVVFTADAEITRLNETFVRHRGPTDVITFQHGEIVISTERAVAQARAFGKPVHEELALYLLHGLLHLAGYDDTRPSLRRVMHRRQGQLLRQVRKTLDLRKVLR